MYQKGMTRNMSYVKMTKKINNQSAEVLPPMAAAQQMDHESINAARETNAKLLETLMSMVFEQLKQQ